MKKNNKLRGEIEEIRKKIKKKIAVRVGAYYYIGYLPKKDEGDLTTIYPYSFDGVWEHIIEPDLESLVNSEVEDRLREFIDYLDDYEHTLDDYRSEALLDLKNKYIQQLKKGNI